MTANDKLLEEFPAIGTAAWEQAIARDLKSADAIKTLEWQTPEGLAVKPFYRAEDIAELKFPAAGPGEFPYARGARTAGGWQIREVIDATDPAEANRGAVVALAAGADEIAFSRAEIENASDLDAILAHLKEIPVHFAAAGEPLIQLLIGRLRKQPRAARTSAACDPLANPGFAAETLRIAPPAFTPFAIDAAQGESAEANSAEQIGAALAAGVEYLAALSDCGADIDRAASAVEFSFAIGTNYFFEIAKLRAFRMGWARVVESFGGSRQNAKARIAARTVPRNEAAADAHLNILRGTTAAMAAVLGGADSVVVAPFDEPSKTPDEPSRRLARNTQLLLRHEGCFARVADAGGGAYYLESVTDFLACAAWKAMQETEARGGYRGERAAGPAEAPLTAPAKHEAEK